MNRLHALAFVLAVALHASCACGDDAGDDAATGADSGSGLDAAMDAGEPAAVSIVAAPAQEPAFRAFVAPLASLGVTLGIAQDPLTTAAASVARQRIAVVADADQCAECYALDRDGAVVIVRGGAPLGVQYGVADVLERMGLGFFSPYETHAATDFPRPLADGDPDFGPTIAPDVAIRGLQLHTLHPIEALFDFWMPSPAGAARALLVIDWLVKNRGNLLVWVPLDDILASAGAHDTWQAHQLALIEAAHERGVRVGYNAQLFGASNLQHAYDLLDEVGTVAEQRAAIEDRLGTLLDGLPVDVLLFSFGEFIGAEPAQFLESAGLAATVASEMRPDIELGGLIHVGNDPDLRVEWEGESMLYYFLVAWVDPPIVPWVHTVMYYDLFDDAGGAYHHDDFGEHREFLLDRLRAGEPVGYEPETAYWVAFDDSVPLYLPVYVRSRLRDLSALGAVSDDEGIDRLQRHLLFSTGWEWGYWQNDWASLRMSHTLPVDARALFRAMFADRGDAGAAFADAIADLADEQHRALIEERLAGYVAGSDAVIDLGRDFGTVSQPDPIEVDELVAMSAEERAAFASSVLDPLRAHADAVDAIEARVDAVTIDTDRWVREIRDGIAVDARRVRFVERLLRAVVESLDAGAGDAALARAEALLEEARAIVTARHADLHYPDPTRLTQPGTNATVYPFGYLEKADTLCYWERDRVIATNVVRGAAERPPACVE